MAIRLGRSSNEGEGDLKKSGASFPHRSRAILGRGAAGEKVGAQQVQKAAKKFGKHEASQLKATLSSREKDEPQAATSELRSSR